MLENEYRKLNDNLHIKESAASEMARMAMKEANMIVDTANQNADTIIKEALMMARGILMEIARLGDEANDMKSSMKEELHKIEEALDDFETPAIPKMDLLKKNYKSEEKDMFLIGGCKENRRLVEVLCEAKRKITLELII